MTKNGHGLDGDFEPTTEDLLKEVVPEMVEDGEIDIDKLKENCCDLS